MKVIELYAGPGSGKSTTAAQLFVEMKNRGLKVELVQEYVKTWAWQNQEVTDLDGLYISSKQLRRETLLYGNVDYIITDSPVIMGGFYSSMATNSLSIETALYECLVNADKQYGITRIPVFVKRNKVYHKHGRYQDEAQARALDTHILERIQTYCPELIHTSTCEIDPILNALGLDASTNIKQGVNQ